MFKKYRIKKRLTISFIIVAAIASVAAVVGAFAMFYIANQYDYALKNYGFSQGDIGKAMVVFADAHSATRAVIGYTDGDVIAEAVETHDLKKENCTTYMETIKGTLTSPDEIATYEAIEATMNSYWQMEAQILELGNTTDAQKSAEAQLMAANQLLPLYDETYGYMAELMALNVTTGNELQSSLNTLRMVLLIVIIGVIAAAVVLSVLLGNNIAGGIARPMSKLAERLTTFAQGELSSEFPAVEAEDEVADMVRVAGDMASNLAMIIQDAKYRLGEMADGNYTVESKIGDKYVGEFQELNTAMHQMNLNMNDTLHQIEDASDQVSVGAGNLAEASQSLAEGATEQAGAIEELLATITNLTDGIGQTSENIDEAYKMSRNYANKANESSEAMQTMVETMMRISETSKKIESIISDIEEIASQTNLLSLNASIEAARAGEAGRGFAVVADQIGKLADESAQSAVHTRELIMSAISEIESGTSAAEHTATSIDEVVDGINHVADASQRVAELSQTNLEAMKQAEAGINQISEVVQANSATAQESSATSEELSAQATTMDTLVKKFQLK